MNVILAAALNIAAIAQSFGLAADHVRVGEPIWMATVWIPAVPQVRYVVLAGPTSPDAARSTLTTAKDLLERLESLSWLRKAMNDHPDIQVRVSIMAGTMSMPPNLIEPCNVFKTAFVSASEGNSLLWSRWLMRDNGDLELYMFDAMLPRFPFGERWYSQIAHVEMPGTWSYPAPPGVVIHPDGTSGPPRSSCLPR